MLYLNLPGRHEPICAVEELARPGPHDQENALAAACVAGLAEVPAAAIAQALKTFPGLPHRQQRVAEIGGITFINDSKSTTVASGLKAVEAASGRVVLIAGGRDKGGDFRALRARKDRIKAAVLIGEDGAKIASCLKGAIPVWKAGTLSEAVRLAYALAQKGDCVLLSPMCASFDMFRNFEERGERFMELVRQLAEEATFSSSALAPTATDAQVASAPSTS
jgi:UDP-N-acetylmuramoylalanine--D-glutamate ligase